jgi:hypothetical protein
MTRTAKLLSIAGCLALSAAMCAGQGQAALHVPAVAHAFTPPLSSLTTAERNWQRGANRREMLRPRKPGGGGGKPGGGGSGGGSWSDSDLQTLTYKTQFATTPAFQGQGTSGPIPPDTNLAVGVNTTGTTPVVEIVQVVNTSMAVYSTGGTELFSGDLGLSLFATLPASANCNANMDGGDPIVLFDQLDHAWIISQLAYNSSFTQNDFCMAISTSSDPLGTWSVFDFSFGSSLPDYPKLALWGDGIYFSANMFKVSVNPLTGSTTSKFLGARACSYPRPLQPLNPPVTNLTCSAGGNTAIYNILPASLDGSTLPGVTGDYYLQFVTNLSTTSGNVLQLYQLQSGNLVALSPLSVATFHEACGGTACVPQLGTTMLLDSLGDRLMYRLSYRNYGGSQAMVVNHSVQVNSSSNQTGIRWYKLCSTGNTSNPFSVCSQSTFRPDSSTYRWMGSIAQDQVGNLGLGYSTSGTSSYPSIAVTGMENGVDGGMETESQLYAGMNFQDTYNRWGDYSSMAIDPSDDCTFWYTTEYSTTANVLGVWNYFWGTAIGSFKFSNCPAVP